MWGGAGLSPVDVMDGSSVVGVGRVGVVWPPVFWLAAGVRGLEIVGTRRVGAGVDGRAGVVDRDGDLLGRRARAGAPGAVGVCEPARVAPRPGDVPAGRVVAAG